MAIFGYDTEETTVEYTSADNKRGTVFQLTEDGNVTSMSWYGRSWGKVKCVIYVDDAGTPKARKGISEELDSGMGTLTWHTHNFSPSVSLSSGYYWLTYHAGDDSIEGRRGSGATDQSAVNSDTYADGPSDPFGTPTYNTFQLCIYATYTPVSSGSKTLSSTFAIYASGSSQLSSTFSTEEFYIHDVVCNPASVQRSGANTTELRCDWHDAENLEANQYTCRFWTRGPPPGNDIYGPFVGSNTKETAQEYHATYDWDPPDGADLGMYDLKATVSK